MLPLPCIICSYPHSELKYANKSALANLTFIANDNSFHATHIYNWRIYKAGSETTNIPNWLSTNDFTSCYVKNESAPDQVYEVKGVKIIYENNESKLYIFQNMMDNCQCKSQCNSSLLLGNILSKTITTVGVLSESMKVIKDEEVGRVKTTLKYLEYILKSSRVFIF